MRKDEEYRSKAKTISDWVERDQVRQDKIDNTPPPSDLLYLDCKAEMASDFKLPKAVVR